MPATDTVLVTLLMRSAVVIGSTNRWVFSTHTNLMLVDLITMGMMKVPFVEIVLMAVVLHDRMATVRTVHVRVRLVNVIFGRHFSSP